MENMIVVEKYLHTWLSAGVEVILIFIAMMSSCALSGGSRGSSAHRTQLFTPQQTWLFSKCIVVCTETNCHGNICTSPPLPPLPPFLLLMPSWHWRDLSGDLVGFRNSPPMSVFGVMRFPGINTDSVSLTYWPNPEDYLNCNGSSWMSRFYVHPKWSH